MTQVPSAKFYARTTFSSLRQCGARSASDGCRDRSRRELPPYLLRPPKVSSRFEAIRRLAVDVLRHFRCVCHTAQTHEEAVRLFAHDIDIKYIILDCEVPGGDLKDFVARVRALRSDTKIIGTSGKDKQAEFRDLGIFDFLPKPWEVNDLLRALEQVGNR